MERYLRVNLLGPGPRLMKKEFTGSRSHKGVRNTAVSNAVRKRAKLMAHRLSVHFMSKLIPLVYCLKEAISC